MCHATSSSLEWSNHVQTPYCKRPCYWDCLQCRCWLMTFCLETLTTLAVLHQILSRCKCSRPVETMSESFAGDGLCRRMMTTFTLMNISEKLQTSVLFNTSLEDTSCTFAQQFIVDYCVCPRSAADLL